MAKKTSVKRVSDKSKGKEIEKKLIKDLRSPKKTSPKKKINKNLSSKTIPKVRVKTKAKAEAKVKVEVEKKTKKKIILKKKDEGKTKTEKVAPARLIKKKTAAKRKEKILPKSVKETGAKKIAEKPLRKVKTKIKAKTKAKVERKEKTEKKIKKTASKIGKKVPAEKTKKIPPKKPAKKPTEKVKVEDKIAVKKKTKAKPEKTVKKIIAKVQEKALPAEAKEIEARRPVKAAIWAKEETKEKVKVEVKEKIREKVKAPPSIEQKIPLIPSEEMPSEYGENEITLMIVDPYKLFAFWEVREDTLKIFKGDLQIRLYDITGVDFNKSDANSYLDLPVTERIGRTYIDAVPEKEFIADIGIVYEGIFITIARSNIVSTPRASVSEGEGLLPPKLYETGIRIGY